MILNKGRHVNFGGTRDFLEVQGEGVVLVSSSISSAPPKVLRISKIFFDHSREAT